MKTFTCIAEGTLFDGYKIRAAVVIKAETEAEAAAAVQTQFVDDVVITGLSEMVRAMSLVYVSHPAKSFIPVDITMDRGIGC